MNNTPTPPTDAQTTIALSHAEKYLRMPSANIAEDREQLVAVILEAARAIAAAEKPEALTGETPRTDAFIEPYRQFGEVPSSLIGFARTLEKELTAERAEADRLRKNIGCARNQGTTQFCHEAVDAKAEAERLRAELKGTMHAGGYDYFSGLLKQMDEVAHNARYVAEQEKARAEDGERQLKLLSSELAIRCSNLDRLHDELAIRDTEMQVQADLANKHFAELTRLRAVVDVPVNYDAIPTSDVKEVS